MRVYLLEYDKSIIMGRKGCEAMSRKKDNREELLLRLMHLQGHNTTEEAVQAMNVSQATVRRMFLELKSAGRSSAITAARSCPRRMTATASNSAKRCLSRKSGTSASWPPRW
jgi:transposase